jgi:hypothetical protein
MQSNEAEQNIDGAANGTLVKPKKGQTAYFLFLSAKRGNSLLHPARC